LIRLRKLSLINAAVTGKPVSLHCHHPALRLSDNHAVDRTISLDN
jgi:hypothetical protein